MRFDETLFRAINGWPDALNPMFQLLSEGNKWWAVRTLLLGIIIGMVVFGKQNGRKAMLLSLLSVPIANEICDSLKAIFQDPRPCVELSDVIIRVNKLTSFGTASSHAANMAALATVMCFLVRPYGYIWAGIAFLTGLSRIYVGVHYPAQVLLGWTVGILVGTVVVFSYRWIANRFNPTRVELADENPEVI